MIDPVSWKYVDFIWGPNVAEINCELKYGACLFPNKANWTSTTSWYVCMICGRTLECLEIVS